MGVDLQLGFFENENILAEIQIISKSLNTLLWMWGHKIKCYACLIFAQFAKINVAQSSTESS